MLKEFFQNLFGCLLKAVFVSESKAQNARLCKRHLNFEILENRELLSANPIDDLITNWPREYVTSTYKKTLTDAKYSREIVGGTVSGTITTSITNENEYGADDVLYELESVGENAAWKLISGSRWQELSISESESCEGSGSYSTNSNGINLNGAIAESWEYTTTSTNAKITETYDAENNKWQKSTGEGSIQYSESKEFSDAAAGTYTVEGGSGTINNRKISETYNYTETEYLSTGIIDFDQTITSTYKYDAEQTTNTESTTDGNLTGEKKQWTKNEITSTEVLNWSEMIDGGVEFTLGTRNSDFSYDSGVSFTMNSSGNGSTDYSDYYYKSQLTSESDDYEETLDVDSLNIYLDTILLLGGSGYELADDWLDSYWFETGGSITSTELYELEWAKGKDNLDTSQTIWGHNLTGELSWSEDYDVYRLRTTVETFSDGSQEDIEAGIVAGVTGEGTETITHNRNDEFIADEYSYAYYGDSTGGTINGSNESHSNRTIDFTYTFITDDEDRENWYWQKTGEGQIDSLSDWYFEDSAEATITSETQTSEYSHYERADYYEILIVNQTYNVENGWVLESIVVEEEGNSNSNDVNSYAEFDYEIENKVKVTTDYSRSAAGFLTVTGTEFSETKNKKTEHQDITHAIVDGVIERETAGQIVETNETSSSYSGSGEYHTPVSDECCGSGCGCEDFNIPLEENTVLAVSEIYSDSFQEVITTDWNNQLDEDNELIFTSTSTAELTSNKAGGYSFDYEFDFVIDTYGYNSNTGYFVATYNGIFLTVSVTSDYSSALTETWTKSNGANTFSLSTRTGTYEDSFDSNYDYEYNYRELSIPSGVSYNSQNVMSSAYDSYEVIGEHQESSDEYSNEAEKNWSTTDATIEVNDYVIELLEILCEANTLNEAEYTSIGYHYWGYESFSLRSNAYFMVSSVIRSPSINTNFTNNGAKTTYSHNAPITTTITNATLPTLETPLTNSLAFTDLATAKPDFINAVSEMPEPKGEKPVVPEIVPPLAVIAVASPPVGQSASTEPPEIVKSFFISMWDGVHNALDIAGLIPGVGEIADGTNGLIYLAEGDRVNAGISAASMIPFAGWGVTAGKAAKKVAGAVGDTTEQIAKHTDDIVDAGKNAAKNEKAIPVGSRAQSNHLKGRYDFEHASYDMALSESRKRLGDLGQSTKKMYDPQTGTLIGERSLDAKKGWRIDGDHVNWWDWTKGKKGSGGKYGHDFFPSKQSGPHSKGPGYAEWE